MAQAHPFSMKIPYVAKLDSQIKPGQTLVVRGQATGDGFAINLSCGGPESPNIVLHVNGRLSKKNWVLNTLQNNVWGKEETYKSTLKHGEEIDVRIRCHDKKFEFFAEGKSVAEFDYRVPLFDVTHVVVDGQLTLNSVGWEGDYYSNPYQMPITGGFGPGRKLQLALVPLDDTFSVNFMTNHDRAFHFNPRYNKKNTVNNSEFGGNWGEEEMVPKIPFEKKKAVQLVFECEREHFTVFANGQHYCNFVHRCEPKNINALLIEGKMELQVVNLQ